VMQVTGIAAAVFDGVQARIVKAHSAISRPRENNMGKGFGRCRIGVLPCYF